MNPCRRETAPSKPIWAPWILVFLPSFTRSNTRYLRNRRRRRERFALVLKQIDRRGRCERSSGSLRVSRAIEATLALARAGRGIPRPDDRVDRTGGIGWGVLRD